MEPDLFVLARGVTPAEQQERRRPCSPTPRVRAVSLRRGAPGRRQLRLIRHCDATRSTAARSAGVQIAGDRSCTRSAPCRLRQPTVRCAIGRGPSRSRLGNRSDARRRTPPAPQARRRRGARCARGRRATLRDPAVEPDRGLRGGVYTATPRNRRRRALARASAAQLAIARDRGVPAAAVTLTRRRHATTPRRRRRATPPTARRPRRPAHRRREREREREGVENGGGARGDGGVFDLARAELPRRALTAEQRHVASGS